MTEQVFVLNEGESIPTTSEFESSFVVGRYNLKTSVNPRVVTEQTSNSTALGIHCYEILKEDSATVTVTASYNNDKTINFTSGFPLGSNSLTEGALVSGTGIPAGAYIESVTNSNRIELSAATTGNAQGGGDGVLTITNVGAGGCIGSNVLNRIFPSGSGSSAKYDGSLVNVYGVNEYETSGSMVTVDMTTTPSTGAISTAGTSTTRDEFIIIYADNVFKHHIAKITNRVQHEDNLYNINFTPSLKENIPANTKIAIYQGPKKTDTSVAAVGYGLHNDVTTSEERHDKYVEVSKPTFYFYEGNTLDPSRKYTVLKTSKSTGVVATKTFKSVFVTAPVTSGFIIDKGFFTHNGEVVDNNQLNDTLHFTTGSANGVSPRGINTATAQGGTYTFNHSTWTGSSKNYDDTDGSLPTYINFITSPTRSQILSVPFSVSTSKTITNKGNMFKAEYFDTERMLEHKINDNEGIKIKDMIHQTTITDEPTGELPGLYSKVSNTTISAKALVDQDIRNLLYDGSSAYEPILIGNYYYTISGITAPINGSQTITVSNRRAVISNAYENISVNGTDNHSNAKASRSIWSPVVSNMLVGHDIDTTINTNIYRNNIQLTEQEADIYNLEYNIDGDYAGFNLNVKKGDKNDGFTELISIPSSSYYSGGNIMGSLSGNLITNKVVFEGEIESIDTSIEGGAFKLSISGRDDISKLIGSPLNKNYTYSDEYVYSTITPFTDTFTSTGLTATTDTVLTSNSIPTTGTSTIALTYGDVLYIRYSYDSDGAGTSVTNHIPLGVVGATKAVSTTGAITLLTDSLVDLDANYDGVGTVSALIYVGNKKLLAGKSLTSHHRDSSATTLYGSLDKAYVMKGTGSTFNLTSEDVTFSNYNTKNSTEDPKIIIGNLIDKIVATQGTSAEPTDSPLGFNVETDMMGSLHNLNVIGSLETGNNTMDIEVGYISPIVLGRLDENTLDTFYTTASDLGLINTQGLDTGGFLHLLDNMNSSSGSVYGYAPTTFRRILADDRDSSSVDIYNNYGFRFGSPIFRYNNLSKTSLKYYRNKIHMINKTNKPDFNTYYFNNDISFKGSASAFGITGSSVIAHNLNTDFTSAALSNKKDLPITSRGYLPVVGSTTQDITNYPDIFESSYYNLSKVSVDNPTWLHDDTNAGYTRPKLEYEMDDPSIFNAFLMAPGDMLPESQKRFDHVFNTTMNRNISDYYLMVKYKSRASNIPITHSNYTGSTQIPKIKDTDYEYFPISNDLTTTPKRFSVLKLRHMTVDVYMNEVNYETYKLNSAEESSPESTSGLGYLTHPIAYPKSIPEAGYSIYKCNTRSATTNSTTIQVDNIAGIKLNHNLAYYAGGSSVDVNTFLYTDPTSDVTGVSRYLGEVSSTSGTGPVITLSANCLVVGYTGEIFTTDYIWGDLGTGATTLKNANQIKWDNQVNPVGNNHNVVKLDGDASYTMVNLQTMKRYAGGNTAGSNLCPFLHKGTVTFSNRADVETGVDSVRINFPSPGGTNGNANIILSNHFVVGQIISIASHTNSAFNVNYTVTGIDNQGETTTYIDCITSGTMVNDTNAVSVVIVTNTKKEGNIAHPYRMINGAGIVSDIATTDISIYNDMELVVVGFSPDEHFGSKAAYQYNTERDMYLRDATNIGTTIDSAFTKRDLITDSPTYDYIGFDIPLFLDHQRASSATVITSDGDGTSVNGNPIRNLLINVDDGDDLIVGMGVSGTGIPSGTTITSVSSNGEEIGLSANWTGNTFTDRTFTFTGYAPSGVIAREDTMHQAHAEVLYIPKIDMAATNVSKVEGAEASDYTTEGYIKIVVDFDIEKANNTHDEIETLSEWIHYIGDLTGKFLYNENDKTLHQILNHNISKLDTTTAFVHYLHIDNYTHGNVGSSDIFSVLTIANDTFAEDKKSYVMNEMLGTNVINPKTNKFFTNERTKTDFTITDTTDDGFTWTKGEHAVKAMYVIAELDGYGSTHLIHRDNSPIFHADTGNKFYPESSYQLHITDGNNTLNTNMLVTLQKFEHSFSRYVLTFDEMESMKGCVSLGETFTISVVGNTNKDIESVKIVSAFTIVPEVDDIANDILSELDIEYTAGVDTSQYYLGLNYTGENAFTAINNALSFKNQKLHIDGSSIQVVSNEDAKDFRSIEFNEDENTYKIVSIRKTKSLYDSFNSVVVYGDNVKGIAKNRRDIKKKRERVKEIYDFSLVSQIQVDQKARDFLQLYNTSNKALTIEVGDKIPHLQPKQLVSVYYPSENIYRGSYMVVEIEKRTGSPTKIYLGEYDRDLANTFAMLLGETRNLQGRTQQKVYKSVTSPNIDIETVRVKFVKAAITSSSSSAGNSSTTLGFTKTIGFTSGLGL